MSVSLTVQLITVSIVTLQRQLSHNLLANRNAWNSEYDFVVVGAGGAGCVVAARLSENANFTVLLIEAGGPETVSTDMPALVFNVLGIPDLNWGFTSVSQSRAEFAFQNQITIVPAGRGVGGSSAINGLNYSRGNRRCFDNWVNIYGSRGWSYEQVLPYFTLCENNTDNEIVRQNPEYHGTRGPLTISSVQNPDPILLRIQDIYGRQGIPAVDINGGQQFGTMIVQQTINSNGVRASSSNSYLQPVFQSRPNLHIITRSQVTKILTRSGGHNTAEAYGVLFTRDDREYTVNARREVIVSAGSINTAKLLMLSGIGPHQHLEQLAIPVVADIPVGRNFMDHIFLPLLYTVNSDSYLNPNSRLDISNLYEFYTRGSGPLRSFPFLYAYINSPLNVELDFPDALIAFFRVQFEATNVTAMANIFNSHQRSQWIDYYSQLSANSTRILCVGVVQTRPDSRGTVRLASRDPTEAPLIDPNYYSSARDLAVHVALVSDFLEMADTPEFRALLTGNPLPIPGCRTCGPTVPLYRCYSYITCLVQSLSISESHPCCSCRMGSATDANAVVDERLRVRGVSRLRVIDASVFPQIPNGNLFAPTVMVAERGVDLIRSDNSF